MASHRLKPLFSIKECSSCGSLYTRECCSIGSLENKILVPEPDSSPCCAKCRTPVDGSYCRGCTFLRKKFEEDLLTYCVENGIFQDFQDTSESSDDNTNVINAPREPFVVNQDLGVKDYIPLEDIIARYSTSKAITPDLPIEEPDNSLSMGDEHLDTILETESDEVIKSSVEILVPIPSESEGISDDTSDVPTSDNNRVNVEIDLVESLSNHDTSIVYSSKIDPNSRGFHVNLARYVLQYHRELLMAILIQMSDNIIVKIFL
ncbi:hypothetical protein Tco_0226926 [Tanacetum coccineum]